MYITYPGLLLMPSEDGILRVRASFFTIRSAGKLVIIFFKWSDIDHWVSVTSNGFSKNLFINIVVELACIFSKGSNGAIL